MFFKSYLKKVPKALRTIIGGLTCTYLSQNLYQQITFTQSHKNSNNTNSNQQKKEGKQTTQISEKEIFIKELIDSLNKDTNNINDKNQKIRPLKNQIQNDEALLILTFSLLSEYKSLIQFLQNFQNQNQNTNLYIAFAENYNDIEEIEKKSKRQILSQDQKLNFFSFYNNIFDRIQYLVPSNIYDQNIFKKLKKPDYISNQNEFDEILRKIPTDEIMLAFSDQNQEMKKLVFENNYINFNKTQILYKDIPHNKFELYIKNKRNNNQIERIEIETLEDHNQTLQKVIESLKMKLGFDQNFFNYNDDQEQFFISFKIDKNIVPKVLREYINENIYKVKQRLGDDAKKFKFMQINTKHHNSEKNWIQVKGIDIKKYDDKVFYKYQNNNSKDLDKYLMKNREEWEAHSLYYVPQFQQYSEEEIFDFCKSILDKTAEYSNYSQKIFSKNFYSNKTTANTFDKDIVQNNYNQVLFIHSNHCHGCKKFLPVYEKLAHENLQKKHLDLVFNRINNDFNHNNNQPYHWTTPKIQIYRREDKTKPFEYRHSYLNEKLLQDFLKITTKFQIIDWSKLDNVQNLERINVQINLQLILIQQMENSPQLTKPIKDIRPGVHCYNVYCKVVEVDVTQTESTRGDSIITALGVVADETGCANFRLRNDHCKVIKKGVTIAIRNGKSNVVDEHILLDLDKFGRITLEPEQNIQPNTDNNISDEVWDKRKKN